MTISLFCLAVIYFIPSGRCRLLVEGGGDRELRVPGLLVIFVQRPKVQLGWPRAVFVEGLY